MGMMADCHPEHTFFQLYSEPSDFGFNGLARNRTWVIGAHNTKTTCRYDPYEVKDLIVKEFCARGIKTDISDYLIGTRADIMMEAKLMAERRGVLFQAENLTDLSYMMTEREMTTKNALDQRYRDLYQCEPSTNHNLVYNLADSASYGSSWSAASQRIPTYRVNAKTSWYWIPSLGRFMCSREKLMSMGWPVSTSVAEAMGCPAVGCSDVKRAGDLAGNAMHFQTSAIMQLVSLSCFAPAS